MRYNKDVTEAPGPRRPHGVVLSPRCVPAEDPPRSHRGQPGATQAYDTNTSQSQHAAQRVTSEFLFFLYQYGKTG